MHGWPDDDPLDRELAVDAVEVNSPNFPIRKESEAPSIAKLDCFRWVVAQRIEERSAHLHFFLESGMLYPHHLYCDGG